MDFKKYLKEIGKIPTTPVDKIAVIIFFLGIAFIVYALNSFSPKTLDRQNKILTLNESKNILFLGIDEMLDIQFSSKKDSLWRGRSDTIIVANCNPEKNRVSILNIPRDTKIKVNKNRAEKINFINAIGGPKLTKTSLEKLLGIKIDHYFIVNLHGLAELIDAAGGIEIDVPKRMKYSDHTAMLYIDLMPGKQKLNGRQSIQFVRFRHDGLGDIGRIQRQQAFIKAASEKLKNPRVIALAPKLLSKFKETVLTDMKPKEIIEIANFVKNVPSENQKIAMLPGKFSTKSTLSYWIPTRDGTFKLVEDFFPNNKLSELLKKIDEQKKQNQEADKEVVEEVPNENQDNQVIANNEKPINRRIKVEDNQPEANVINNKIKISLIDGTSSGKEYIERLKSKLVEYGYTILNSEKYTLKVSKTIIYAKDVKPEAGSKVFKDLGHFGELIVSNFGSLEADVTILAGEDIKQLELLTVE